MKSLIIAASLAVLLAGCGKDTIDVCVDEIERIAREKTGNPEDAGACKKLDKPAFSEALRRVGEKFPNLKVAVEPGPNSAIQIPAPPAKQHNYSFKDSYEYGYERAVSDQEKNNGIVTPPLVVFKYAGHRDDKYQVYVKDQIVRGAVTVLECSNPCEFIKAMTFYNGEMRKKEHLRAMDKTLGWLALEDAINGRLEQYVTERNNRKVTIWFDEKKGVNFTPVK